MSPRTGVQPGLPLPFLDDGRFSMDPGQLGGDLDRIFICAERVDKPHGNGLLAGEHPAVGNRHHRVMAHLSFALNNGDELLVDIIHQALKITLVFVGHLPAWESRHPSACRISRS